tara:strand:- start:520 stop:651 length:132 start_codon:yes stop_codon:yes gene_type:complete
MVVDGIDPVAEAAELERARLRESDRHFVPIHVSGPGADSELQV